MNKLNRYTSFRLSYLLLALIYCCNIGFSVLCFRYAPASDVFHTYLIISFILYFISITVTLQFFIFKDYTYFFYIIYIHINIAYYSLIFSSTQEVYNHLPGILQAAGSFLSVPLLVLMYVMYTMFATRFVHAKKVKKADRLFTFCIRSYVILFLISICINLLPLGQPIQNVVKTLILVSCMPLGLLAIFILYRYLKTTIVRIFLFGSLCFFCGSVAGFLFANGILAYPNNISPFNQWVFYTEMGTLLEILLFTSSFAYRNKVMLLEDQSIKDSLLREMLENKEKEEKLQNIRNEIAGNLHDDIGASLSNINILNELAKRNQKNPVKAAEYLDKAGENIQRISEDLSDIVWNINPRYDDVQHLFVKMKHYAVTMMEGKNIRCSITIPDHPGKVNLPMNKRRDFYLIFKEAINNMAKYSQADHASIIIRLEDNQISMELSDNGCGFDITAKEKGNGLINMAKRAKACDANLRISSKPGEGTSLNFIMGITP